MIDLDPVGLAVNKDLTTAKAQDWLKTPGKPGGDQTKKGDGAAQSQDIDGNYLVDVLNARAKELGNVEVAGTTSKIKNGYVTREIPAVSSDKKFLEQMIEIAYATSGAGGPETQLAQVMARHDRFNHALVPKNAVFSGFTFFTRPRLNLADWNLIGDRKFGSLKQLDTTSMSFAIRCLLDTKFGQDNDTVASKCQLFDKYNPFLIPVCNALKSISGFNDPNLVTETSEGGFFSEDQTVVIGGDRLARTYDMNCQFRDYPGSPIAAIFDYWTQYMANIQDGSMQQYPDSINANRIDYTVSIYRFLMDRTNRYIQRWAKCTGCYPIAPPTGVPFNMNEGELMVNAASEFSVPFKANRIEYDDPVILKEFNMLVRRYSTGFSDGDWTSNKLNAFTSSAQNNFAGIPYVRPGIHGFELVWIQRPYVKGEGVVEEGKGLQYLSSL